MPTRRFRHLLYGCLLLSGTACVALAAHQQQYASLFTRGNQAVAASRFDSLDYIEASKRSFAKQDRLLFNQGVLAYKAGNLPQAMDFFRRVSQQTSNPTLRTQSLYNLSLTLLNTQNVPEAVELLKEALRLQPGDTDAKFILEQIFSSASPQQGGNAQPASDGQNQRGGQGRESSEPLRQAPGESKGEGETGSSPTGQGRSTPRPGI
jgi:tetratricopeptide (TPR) repeat protein